MINKEGFSGLGKNLSSPQSPTSQIQSNSQTLGRVTDIIMDENHPKFKELGEYQSIGTIIYENVGGFNTGVSSKIAKPLHPHLKVYPLVGELVNIISSPSPLQTTNNFTTISYYTTPINLWNSPHHNALPNPLKPDDALFNSPTNKSQSSFTEKDNIHPLLPFTGDVIYEGRNGQSIRLGSTSKSQSSLTNSWSNVGKSGDPLIIIRNGQSPPEPNDNIEGWIPITEDLNKDLSTIYLTSSQKLEFNSETINRFKGFNTIGMVTTLNNYFKPQIILNSDRIIINAKDDSILIGSRKSLNLSTEDFINIKSQNLYVDARSVKLGSDTASESIILGDSFLKDFNLLLSSLNTLCSVLEFDTSWPGGIPAPNTPVNMAAASLKTQIEDMKSKIGTSKFTSKISKTI